MILRIVAVHPLATGRHKRDAAGLFDSSYKAILHHSSEKIHAHLKAVCVWILVSKQDYRFANKVKSSQTIQSIVGVADAACRKFVVWHGNSARYCRER